MKHELWVYGLIALGLGASGNALAQAAAPDTDAIVKAVMADQYKAGGFDAKNACWKYTFTNGQDDEVDYCMRAGKPQVVDTPNGKIMYLNATNAGDIHGDLNYAYSQNQTGLMASFKIRLGGKQGWTYLAIDKDMDYGTAGQCGCESARFVKLSNAGDYGWLFTSGGMWQGTVSSVYVILRARNGGFDNISRIPEVVESQQGTKYVVTIPDDPSQKQGLFPVHVSKQKAGAAAEEIVVKFDDKKAVYALPAGR